MRPRLIAIVLMGSCAIAGGQEPPPPTDLKLGEIALKFDPIKMAGLPDGAIPIVLRWDAVYRLALAGGDSGSRQDLLTRTGPLSHDEYARLREQLTRPRDDRGAAFPDPTPDLLDLMGKLYRAESSRYPVVAYEQLLKLYQEYIRGGASSGVTQRDVDEVALGFQDALRESLENSAGYRNALDELKVRLGLPVDAPIVVDWSAFDGFSKVFQEADRWISKEEKDDSELMSILKKLPDHADVMVDGKSFVEASRLASDNGASLIAKATRWAKDTNSAIRVREQLRRFAVVTMNYDMERTRLLILIRSQDTLLQRIIAPPKRLEAASEAKEQASQTRDLFRGVAHLHSSKARVVSLWLESLSLRHSIGRELDLLPRTRDELIGGLTATALPTPRK